MTYTLMVALALLAAVCKGYLILIHRSEEVQKDEEIR